VGTVLFIIGLIVVLIGLAGLGFSEEPAGKGGGLVAAIVGIGITISSFVTTVDARAVGLETSGGRYVGLVPSGVHMTRPWSSVDDWSTRNQTIQFDEGEDDKDSDNFDNEPRITVKLANQSEMYVSGVLVWNVGASTVTKTDISEDQKEKIKALWAAYKSFGDMKKSFIRANAQTSATSVMGSYDPFARDGNGNLKITTPADWSTLLTTDLKRRYADKGIVLESFQVTRIDYDQKTQEKLSQINQEVVNTQIAAQKVKTAEQEALASKTRAAEASKDCLSFLRDMAEKDQIKNLPAGWQCPGTQGPAVVGSTK
jgi:hypothetical protein